MTSPLLWLAISGWLAVGGTYVFEELRRGWDYKAALAEGRASGLAAASSAGVESANQTLTIIREAEAAMPVPADKAAIIALCKRSASCRERGQLK